MVSSAKRDGNRSNPAKEVDVARWVDEEVKKEIARLKTHNYSCIPVKVNNTAIIREDNCYINRVECDTAFNFDRVEMILISEPVECPQKQGYNYVHVILFCNKIPLILPYLYDSSYEQKGHNLKEWLFINNKLQSSRQSVDKFEDA